MNKFTNIFNNLLRADVRFRESVMELFLEYDINLHRPTSSDLVVKLVDQLHSHISEFPSSASWTKTKLQAQLNVFLKRRKILSFIRVIQLSHQMQEESPLKDHNSWLKYLKNLKFSSNGNINMQDTSTAILKKLNPNNIKLIGELTEMQKYFIEILTPEQKDLLSNIHLKNIPLLVKISTLGLERSSLINLFKILQFPKTIQSMLNVEQQKLNALFQNLNVEQDLTAKRNLLHSIDLDNDEGMDILNTLLSFDSDKHNLCKDLINHHPNDLKYIIENVNELSNEEKSFYLILKDEQMDILKDFNEEDQEIIEQLANGEFENLLPVVADLSEDQIETILSLTKKEIEAITEPRYLKAIQKSIKKLPSYEEQHVPMNIDGLTKPEENRLLNIPSQKVEILNKIYTLGCNAPQMLLELNKEQTSQVFQESPNTKDLNLIQKVLIKRIDNLAYSQKQQLLKQSIIDEIEDLKKRPMDIPREITRAGIIVLRSIQGFSSHHLDMIQSLSKIGLAVLANNQKLKSDIMKNFWDLPKEQKQLLLNLNWKQRYELQQNKLKNLYTKFFPFNGDQKTVLLRINKAQESIWSTIVPLTEEEQTQLNDWNSLGPTSLEGFLPIEKNILETLGPVRAKELAYISHWSPAEKLSFEFWKTIFSREKLSEHLKSTLTRVLKEVPRIPLKTCPKYSKLMAAITVGSLTNKNYRHKYYIHEIVPELQTILGKMALPYYYLNLLEFSVENSLKKNIVYNIAGKIRGYNEIDPKFFSKNYDISDEKTIPFFKSMLIISEKNVFFYKLTRSAILKSISKSGFSILIDNILIMEHNDPRAKLINVMKKQLRQDHYELTQSLIFQDHSISDRLIQILDKDDAFILLNSKPLDGLIQKHSLGPTNIFDDEDLIDPNFLDFSLYYNRGNIDPFVEMLEPHQLNHLVNQNSLILFHLMVRCGKKNLLELIYNRVGREQFCSILSQEDHEILIELVNNLEVIETQAHSPNYYQEIAEILRWFREVDPTVDQKLYRDTASEYIHYVKSHVSDELVMNDIVQTLITDQVSRDDLMDFNDKTTECGTTTRVKRSSNEICIDSNNMEEEFEETERQHLNDLFNELAIQKKVRQIELYNKRMEFTNKIDEPQVEEQLNEWIDNLNMDDMEVDTRNYLQELRTNRMNGLKKYGLAEKIQKISNRAGLLLTIFVVGRDLSGNDYINGLENTALNFYLMPKVGEKISETISDFGLKLNSRVVTGFGPILGRVLGNYFALKGLHDAILMKGNSTDPVDEEFVNLNIITNSIYILADVPAMITGFLQSYEIDIGVIGELTGPIGMLISVVVLFASMCIDAHLRMEKMAEHISLTAWEKFELQWDFFIGRKIPEDIELDIEVENIYEKYTSNVIRKFNDTYSRVAISLPAIRINKKIIAVAPLVRKKRFMDSTLMEIIERRCHEKIVNSAIEMINAATSRVMKPFGSMNLSHRSRAIPQKIDDYHLICGPNDSVDKKIKKTAPTVDVSRHTCATGMYYNNRQIGSIQEFLNIPENKDCPNMVLYERNNSLPNSTIFFYATQNTFITIPSNTTVELISLAPEISVTDDQPDPDTNYLISSRNRFHLTNLTQKCKIHKKGLNYFYTTNKTLNCDLNLSKDQSNVAVIQGAFRDSENITSITGSTGYDSINAFYARYVDGQGGHDSIIIRNSSVVKAYSGDSIAGKAMVLLPMNLEEIDTIIAITRLTVYGLDRQVIKVDRNALLKTKDGYFVVPTRTDNKTKLVTDLKIYKTSREGHEDLRKITNPRFRTTKILSDDDVDFVITDHNANVFFPDKDNHNYHWETNEDLSSVYVIDQINANINVSRANGIIDLANVNTFDHPFSINETEDKGIQIKNDQLKITLLPNYNKNIMVTYDRFRYFQLSNNTVVYHGCSHPMKVTGRKNMKATELPDLYNCFVFDSIKVLFFKFNNHLKLVSGGGILSIKDYYSPSDDILNLSIKLNNKIILPETFKKMASRPRTLKVYKFNETKLKIYHNQPVHRNHIGLIDFGNRSITNWNIKLNRDGLIFSYLKMPVLRLKNWQSHQPVREFLFAFNDCFLGNIECLFSICHPMSIVEEFQKEKRRVLEEYNQSVSSKRTHRSIDESIAAASGANGKSSFINYWINGIVNVVQNIPGIVSTSFKNLAAPLTQCHSSPRVAYDRFLTNNVGLGLFLLQSCVDKKYPLPKWHDVHLEETLADASNIVLGFERLLEKMSEQFNLSMTGVDFFQIYIDIVDYVENERYSSIRRKLYSIVETFVLGNEEALRIFKINIEYLFNESHHIFNDN